MNTLVIDVGNSQISFGLYKNGKISLTFRKATTRGTSSDELGTFMRVVLRENGFEPKEVSAIAICSVVPHLMYALRAACVKYFEIQPFTLGAGVKTGVKIKYANPTQVGADRIANAIAAIAHFPNKNAILVDMGTATTVCAVSADASFLGGVIFPGLRLSMEALEAGTAKLPLVEIVRPPEDAPITARTTESSLQNGLYYGTLDSVKGMINRMRQECFADDENTVVIATGGFTRLFEQEHIFDEILPDMVLEGTYLAWKMNQVK